MASVAARRRLFLIEMADMATFARCSAMLAEKEIFRIAVMIERIGFPFSFVMTFLTFLSET